LKRSTGTRDRLLATAERLFAEHGYDGVSMRQIASEAEANLALIHYHFGSKLDIFRAIWALRYEAQVAAARGSGIDAVDFSLPRAALVKALVELFWRPLRNHSPGDGLQNFWVIGSREFVDPHEAQRGMVAEFLDPRAREFIRAFGRALPELSANDLALGFNSMAATLSFFVAGRDRLSRLSGGAIRSGDVHELLQSLIEINTGAWLALADSKAQPGKKPQSGRITSAKSTGSRIRR
jgi:AcrR family transcriptional regulator